MKLEGEGFINVEKKKVKTNQKTIIKKVIRQMRNKKKNEGELEVTGLINERTTIWGLECSKEVRKSNYK